MDSLKKIKKETSGPDHSLDFNSIRDPFHPEITSPAPISPLHISLERRDSYDVISNIPITKECLEAVNNIGLIPLQYAILFDLDQKIVLYLAFQSQFFQVRDSHGNTPLHMLISHSDGFETLRIFTEKCPNISPLEGDQVCRNDQIDNQNPLLGSNFDKLTTFPTTSHEQTHVVRSYISAMVYNKDKMTPVHFFLLQKHHKPNQNQLKFLNYVINNIPYGKQALKMYDCNDDLPIHIALKNYAISTNVIQSLVNQMDTLDYFLTPSHLDTPTILHLPDLNTKTLEMLVGIAPEEVFTTVDLDGRNPLHKLIEDSAGGPMLSIAPGIAVSIFLKSKNSHLSIYMEDYQGNTPIHLILQFLPNCVEKIVEIDGKNLKKCLIMVDKYRQTPLHSAAQYCDVDIIAFLVGVDWVVESFSMVDSRGRLPMHLMLIYQEDDDVYISLEDIIMKYSDRL